VGGCPPPPPPPTPKPPIPNPQSPWDKNYLIKLINLKLIIFLINKIRINYNLKNKNN
jgi:hypothetical protein